MRFPLKWWQIKICIFSITFYIQLKSRSQCNCHIQAGFKINKMTRHIHNHTTIWHIVVIWWEINRNQNRKSTLCIKSFWHQIKMKVWKIFWYNQIIIIFGKPWKKMVFFKIEQFSFKSILINWILHLHGQTFNETISI